MRSILIALAMMTATVTAAAAKDRATFLLGQYATSDQCEKLRKIEAGTARNVETAPELLDASGFHSWEGACEFTKVFEHDPGKSWTTLMVCAEGATITPELYHFVKNEIGDSFDVSRSSDEDAPETYERCDAK